MPSSPRLLMGFATEGGVFKNWARGLQSSSGQTAGTPYPALLTNDGYPSNGAALTANYSHSFAVPQDVTTTDDCFIKLTNAGGAVGGDIQIARGAPGFSNVVATSGSVVGGVSFNLALTGMNPRAVFRWATSVPTGNVTFNFMASGTFSGCTNLVIGKVSDEAAIDAATTPEDLFYQAYVEFYLALNCKIFRPMGWANTNSQNASRHAYRQPWQTGLNYYAQRWIPGAWAGTVSGTDTYSCSQPADLPATPTDGAVVQCQFTNANTASTATIDFGGSWGVKNLITTLGSTTLGAGAITAAVLATLVYDELLDGWMYSSGGISPSVPLEVRLGFANKCGADYWHNIPALYDIASVAAEAAWIRDNLAADRQGYFEWSNETWNPSFVQFHQCNARGLALGFPSGDNRRQVGYTGLRIRQFMGQVTTTWGSRAGLRRVNAFQGFGPDSSLSTYQFNGGDLVSATYPVYASYVGVDYNAAPNRPVDYSDVLSYATYPTGAQLLQFNQNYIDQFNGGFTFPDLLAAADDYDSGDTTRMARALAWVDFDLRQGRRSNGNLGSETLKGHFSGSPSHAAIYPVWNSLAAGYSPPKTVEQYEGASASVDAPTTAACTTMGISTDYGGTTGKIANLIAGYKLSDLFKQLTIDQFNEFLTFSRSSSPALLLVPGLNPWGLVQGAGIYSDPWKSYNAVVAFNNATFGRLR